MSLIKSPLKLILRHDLGRHQVRQVSTVTGSQVVTITVIRHTGADI